jgi:glycosyltransferase involved in cell wall biosynthesis
VATRPHIALLHYTCPPVIGGVETILYEQARRLAARGFPVTILAGRGGPLPQASGVGLAVIPELDSKHPEVTAVRDALDRGEVPAAFEPLGDRIRRQLDQALAGLDAVIAHNALSLHFNLPLTAALWAIADRGQPRVISWVHDLGWVNPLYRLVMHDGHPWDLLRRPHPKITPIFVSEQRRQEWRALTGAPADESQVIPNGLDPAALLKVGAPARRLVARFGLEAVDVLMLAPVRITKRKHLEWAIEAAAAVRASGRSVQLLITGPPGPHNPKAMEYVDELRQLTRRLGLDDAVRFLFELAPPAAERYAVDGATLSDLYMLSDVVTLPSSSEGFGLPLAEAALFRTPVVATDLPAFRELAPEGATLVPLAAGSAGFSAAVLNAIDAPAARLRRNVMRTLSWDHIVRERIEPLLSPPT